MFGIYKQRYKKLLAGVLTGIASRFGWDVWLVRLFVVLVVLFTPLSVPILLAYVLLAVFLPYKEDVDADRYGTGPRKRKEAERL